MKKRMMITMPHVMNRYRNILAGWLSTSDSKGHPKRTKQAMKRKTLKAGFLKGLFLCFIGNSIAVFTLS